MLAAYPAIHLSLLDAAHPDEEPDTIAVVAGIRERDVGELFAFIVARVPHLRNSLVLTVADSVLAMPARLPEVAEALAVAAAEADGRVVLAMERAGRAA
jgi:hypothetical protein